MTNTIITLTIVILALIYAIYRLLKTLKRQSITLSLKKETIVFLQERVDRLKQDQFFSKILQSNIDFLKSENAELKNKQSYLLIEIAELKKNSSFASIGAKVARKKRTTYPNKKLNESDVKYIKAWYKNGYTQQQLAETFGVSRQMISKIVNKK